MKWFGEPDLLLGDVIPLVGITLPCPFLLAAQRVLDAAGRPWRMALTTPSLDGLRAAVEAGLGITCRTEAGLCLPPMSGTSLPQLPQLPEIAYSIVERRQGDPGTRLVVNRMKAHLETAARSDIR